MGFDNVIRTIFFMIFFSIGIAAVALSIVADEFLYYYRQQISLEETMRANEHLAILDEKNRQLLEQIKKDPSILERLAPITLGAEPNEPNAIIPKTGVAELQFARNVLEELRQTSEKKIQIPQWLERINQNKERTILFLSGSGLILISLCSFTLLKIQHKP